LLTTLHNRRIAGRAQLGFEAHILSGSISPTWHNRASPVEHFGYESWRQRGRFHVPAPPAMSELAHAAFLFFLAGCKRGPAFGLSKEPSSHPENRLPCDFRHTSV
jgi:hypothetical protein